MKILVLHATNGLRKTIRFTGIGKRLYQPLHSHSRASPQTARGRPNSGRLGPSILLSPHRRWEKPVWRWRWWTVWRHGSGGSGGLKAWRPMVLQGLLTPTGAGVNDGVRKRPRLAAVRQQRDGAEMPRWLWGVASGSRAAVDVFGGWW